MAKLSRTDSRRMYSWWWDSHISPKNSKWLQENLTDMDAKVKLMIKLIEEDADSFARRAEMYYKKRPELMKLVEEFYRAYRALAERYDNATGVIRHAQRTMTEAFPNQDPMMFSDDSPAGTDPGIPGSITPNGEFTDDDSVVRRKGLRLLNDSSWLVEKVRKGLNFDEEEEKEQVMQDNENNVVKDRKLSKSDEVREPEEIRKLKEAIAKLEAEKEAGLAQCQKSLDKLSQFESEILQTKEDFTVFSDRATKAENEVILLEEALTKLETEKEIKFQEYQKSLEMISNLHNVLNTAEENTKKLDERASSAETEVRFLKGKMVKLALEKDEALNQYIESLERISNLENKLRITEEDSRNLKERAENAENEIKLLKETISKLTNEKNDLSLKYHQCLEMISVLEEKLRISEEEAKRLNVEIDNGVSKLKGAEENCLLLERSNQSLHSELESLMLKMGTQTKELTEKQRELGRLWACVQEERSRFVEAETAFQTLQHLHAKTQEELRFMASELNKRSQLLKVEETRNENLKNEILKVKEENEVSASSIKGMEKEISCLKESKGTLEEEVEIRINKRNALQQEIYCLKEEINNLNKKHVSVLDRVKGLQNENFKLKETCDKESSEKVVLLEKMVILEQLIERNFVLENSLSDLNAELEAVRGKILTLELSCQSLLEEKSAISDEKDSLVIQLDETNKNLEKLSENNTVLENSLSDAHYQFEGLKAKSKILEDSCQMLVNEKDGLITELENTRISLKHIGKIYGELESRCLILEKEKEATVQKVEELQMSLDVERQEHAVHSQVSEKREIEMRLLYEECQWSKRELDQVMDDSIGNEIEIFSLSRIAEELAESNQSIFEMNNAIESKLRDENSNKKALLTQIEHLNRKVIDTKGTWEILEREKLEISEEKRSLMDSFRVLEKNNNILEKEKYVLYDEVLALDAMSLIFRSCADEKFKELRELNENFNKLHHMNVALMGKLSLTEAKLKESKTENLQFQEKLQKSEDELKDFAAIKDQLSNEIENGKQMLHQVELELHELLNERKTREEKLEFELQRKVDEMEELDIEAALVFGKLQFSMISQLLYEQKFHELHDTRISFLNENEDLKTRLDSYGPEILALKECISSLENHTDIHVKFQNPEMEKMQDAQATNDQSGSILNENNKSISLSTFSDLCNLRARLQAIEKASVEIKESMVHENADLRSKLDASTRQLESGRYRRNLRPPSEITEVEKDIMLDQVSDGSSYVELWKTTDDVTKKSDFKRVNSMKKQKGELTQSDLLSKFSVDKLRPPSEITEVEKDTMLDQVSDGSSYVELWKTTDDVTKKSDFKRVNSMKKQKGELTQSDLLSKFSVDKLDISKRFTKLPQEGNKRKVLERLDSDVQKLANLQITVKDLKNKLEVTEKDRRGKAVIECEALKGQLEEADLAIIKLFDLNGKLTKNIDDNKYFPEGKSSFDLEGDGSARRRKVSEQARRMSEKIGRLQIEVQKLQFVLLKLDDDTKEGKAKVPEKKRRVVLRDYFYGGGGISEA